MPDMVLEMDDTGNSVVKDAPKPEDIKLEGDAYPEDIKGKTAADVLKMVNGLKEAVKISEDARKRAEEAAARPPVVQQVVAAPAPQPDPADFEPTVEQLHEAFEKNPAQTLQYIQEHAIHKANKQQAARMAPLTVAAQSMAESSARTKYATEFQLFAKEIGEAVAGVPDKSVLADPRAWDSIVAYVRGNNVDKLIDHKLAQRTKDAEDKARQEAVAGTPASLTGGPRATSVASGGQGGDLDETEREVLRVMRAGGINLDEKSYREWGKR